MLRCSGCGGCPRILNKARAHEEKDGHWVGGSEGGSSRLVISGGRLLLGDTENKPPPPVKNGSWGYL